MVRPLIEGICDAAFDVPRHPSRTDRLLLGLLSVTPVAAKRATDAASMRISVSPSHFVERTFKAQRACARGQLGTDDYAPAGNLEGNTTATRYWSWNRPLEPRLARIMAA